jgi:phytoene dehydrogenase-like protein
VAANALVDAGWDVLLLEAEEQVGGAVRSAELTAPGYVTDLFSAFYPLAAASPVIRELELDRHGLQWSHADSVLAHQFDDGRAVVLSRDPYATAASVESFGEGDGDTWLGLFEHWCRVRDHLLDALFTPFPPVAPGLRLARTLRVSGLLELARLAVLPVRRLGRERFRGVGGPALLTGNAMHSDLPPDAAGSGIFGWLLAMLGQDVGFPVPRGGAQALSDALAARFTAAGGEVRTASRVESIEVRAGRVVAVRTVGGRRTAVRRGVLADVDAPTLYRDLVGPAHLPTGLLDDLTRFEWDHPTLKLNWALRGPVPWRATGSSGAGTVHLGVDLDGFVEYAADLSLGRAPLRPFVLFGQMTTADATRSPAGTESAWAYSHLPRAALEEDAAGTVAAHADRMVAAIERVAPGFAELVLADHRQSPLDLESADSNLVVGALNGGTAALHQQLVFRPTPGLGRPETPVEGLYLASASAHPGGGVHGACGWNAARAALAAHGTTGALRRRLARTAWDRVLGP